MKQWAHRFSAHDHDWTHRIGIIGGLVFTAFTVRAVTKSRRVEDLIRMAEDHPDLGTRFDTVPTLHRV